MTDSQSVSLSDNMKQQKPTHATTGHCPTNLLAGQIRVSSSHVDVVRNTATMPRYRNDPSRCRGMQPVDLLWRQTIKCVPSQTQPIVLPFLLSTNFKASIGVGDYELL